MSIPSFPPPSSNTRSPSKTHPVARSLLIGWLKQLAVLLVTVKTLNRKKIQSLTEIVCHPNKRNVPSACIYV